MADPGATSSWWKQLLVILPVYVLQLCYGMSSGYPAITTPQVKGWSANNRLLRTFLQLQMDCGKFQIPDEEESWIGSSCWIVSSY